SDGTLVDKTIAKSEVDLIHRPVAAERLTALSPERPKEYRDYAEELADKKVDPEARETGLRLYAIAANLDPANLGRSSLLGMTALAASVEEERQYRALAFLLDPEHDRGVLKDTKKTTVARRGDEAVATSDTAKAMGALRALEMLRKGHTQD